MSKYHFVEAFKNVYFLMRTQFNHLCAVTAKETFQIPAGFISASEVCCNYSSELSGLINSDGFRLDIEHRHAPFLEISEKLQDSGIPTRRGCSRAFFVTSVWRRTLALISQRIFRIHSLNFWMPVLPEIRYACVLSLRSYCIEKEKVAVFGGNWS